MTDEQFEALAEEVAAAIVNADLEHVGHFCPWPGPASEAYDSVREDYRQAARVAIRVILKKLPIQQPTTDTRVIDTAWHECRAEQRKPGDVCMVIDNIPVVRTCSKCESKFERGCLECNLCLDCQATPHVDCTHRAQPEADALKPPKRLSPLDALRAARNGRR